MIKRRFGILDQPGIGSETLVLMSLVGFWDMDLEPLFLRKKIDQAVSGVKTEYSVYEFLVDIQHLEEEDSDDQAKVLNILRDPRVVISNSVNGVSYRDWVNHYIRATELADENRFDIITLRWEQIYDIPGVVQDAVGNWLGYDNSYQYHFANAHKYLAALDERRNVPVRYVKELVDEIPLHDLRELSVAGNEGWKTNDVFKQRLKQQIKQYPELPEVLIQFGYEDNDNWVGELNG